MRKLTYVTTMLLLASIACGKKEAPPKPVPKVNVGTVKTETLPIGIDAIGHFTAFNSAEIKAQVEGRLLELHFKEGDAVEEGQLLFTIEPEPFEAAYQKSKATLEKNIANLQFAMEKYERYSTIAPEGYVSELDFHQYITDAKALEKTVMENIAELSLAKINLDYCYIKAPFNGITGKRMIDKGNLITDDGSTMLVIKQMDPIFIDFTVPERDFFKVLKYQQEKLAQNEKLTVKFEITELGEKEIEAELVLIDNKVDEKTGMIPLRAQVANCNMKYWPGTFVRSHLVLKEQECITIPASALSIGQKGQFAYVITKENKVEYRPIKPGEQVGDRIQILEGLKEGETVVTNGQINLRPGITIQIAGEKS